MNTDDAIKQLELRRAEALAIAEGRAGAPSFDTWRPLSWLTLERIYGANHSILEDWDKIRFSLSVWTDRTTREDALRAQRAGVQRAAALLEAAIQERQHLSAVIEQDDGHAIDAELWEHVGDDVTAERWAQAAANAAVFLESKVREWAGLSANDHGKDLMIKVFKGDGGKFPCGSTAGEEQGWQQLATGFVQALSNVDRHRIQNRPDAAAYAMGVIGTASLLLTQLRYQHETRFRSGN
jgi:hypothetical protein